MIKELLDPTRSKDPRVQAERLMPLLANEAFNRFGLEIAFNAEGGLGLIETFTIFPVNAGDISLDQFRELAPKIEEWTHGIFAVREDLSIADKCFTVNYAPDPLWRQLKAQMEGLTPKIAGHINAGHRYPIDWRFHMKIDWKDNTKTALTVVPDGLPRSTPSNYGLKILKLRRELAPKVSEWTSGELSMRVFHRADEASRFFVLNPTPAYKLPAPRA
jgi:hypothetical protein